MFINKNEIQFLYSILSKESIFNKTESINLESELDEVKTINFKVNSPKLENRKLLFCVNLNELDLKISFLNYSQKSLSQRLQLTQTDPDGYKKGVIRNYLFKLSNEFNCKVENDDIKNNKRHISTIYFDDVNKLGEVLEKIYLNIL